MTEPRSRFALHLDPIERDDLTTLVELALTALSFIFIVLVVVEFAVDLTPAWSRRLQLAGYIIWAIFSIEFVVRLALADSKGRFLRSHWLAGLAVILPFFRIFRAARALRAARSLRLARLVTSTNRGMGALRRVAGAGGFVYVAGLTALVLVLSGAGIYSLERNNPDSAIDSWGEGIWWAATTIATLGAEHYPVSPEGRVLGLLVMIFGLAVSGYITAALAVFLLGSRDEKERAETAALLRDEIRLLREEIAHLRAERNAPPG